MKCSIVTIGTELLIGQVIDTNAVFLGEELSKVGVEVISRITVSDDRINMLKAFRRAEEDADLILITGGLGPTKDDITKVVLAEFLNVPMYFDDDQYERIQDFFEKLSRPITEAHKNQCNFPKTIEFLKNEMGTAPGMKFLHNGKTIISMPGVPYEMKSIMSNHVLPKLKDVQKLIIRHKTIQTAGVGETILAELIQDIEDSLPEHVSLAYLPSLGKVRVRITVKGTDKDAVEIILNEYTEAIVARFSKYVFGYDDEKLEKLVGTLLIEKGMKLGLAESCTGGTIASLITAVPGSSAYFAGSVVSYSYELKESLLKVNHDTLIECGAVSEEVVREMVTGAIDLLQVDVAVSVSGIAGPGGGTPEKPVGTVWICVGNKEKQYVRKLTLLKDRSKNIEYSSNAALNLLRLYLEEKIMP